MRVEVKARNNAELLRKLKGALNEEVTEVYVNRRPTKEILVTILERAPNVRKISCPPSLYPKVSRKVINALAQMGIELVPRGIPPEGDRGSTTREPFRRFRPSSSRAFPPRR